MRITLSLILDILKKGLSASVYGGGEPSIQFQVPSDPSYLKEVAAELFTVVKLQVWRFEKKLEASYAWTYSPSGPTSLSAAGMEGIRTLAVSDWHPIPRDYAADPRTYALFRANEHPFHLGGGTSPLGPLGTTVVQATEENLIAAK